MLVQMSRLGTSIRALHAQLAASKQQYDELDRMMAYLRSDIVRRVHASDVWSFGSCSNGLWTNSSDADLTLIVPRCNNKAKIVTKLKVVRDFVYKTSQTPVSMNIVENARIPVLKISLPESCCLREVDLSINNVSGIENSLLVKNWARLDPRFVPLAFTVKHWAKNRGINDRSQGTLSTYTLLLQLVYVMQTRGIVPPFADFVFRDILDTPYEELNGTLRPTPFDMHYDFKSSNTKDDEASLLREFFHLFGDEQLAHGAEILDGSINSSPTGALVMRCPLTNKDVNVLAASAWRTIHSEFTKARDRLRDQPDLDVSDLVS